MKDYSVLLPCGESTMIVIHDAFDKGYKQGYEDGKADTPFTDTEEAEKKAYEKGLNDVWEFIKKTTESADDGGYSLEVLQKSFDCVSVYGITHIYTPKEALAKIKAYEDKQKQDAEIKVGDEVKDFYNHIGVVITDEPSQGSEFISVLFTNQSHVQLYPVKELIKTGKHYPQIAEVLKELRGAENDK